MFHKDLLDRIIDKAMCSAPLFLCVLVQIVLDRNQTSRLSTKSASAVQIAAMPGSIPNDDVWFAVTKARALAAGMVENANGTWSCPSCELSGIWKGFVNDHIMSNRHTRYLEWAAAFRELEAERATGNMPFWMEIRGAGTGLHRWCKVCHKCATDSHCANARHIRAIEATTPQGIPAIMDIPRVSDQMVPPPLPGGLGFRV